MRLAVTRPALLACSLTVAILLCAFAAQAQVPGTILRTQVPPVTIAHKEEILQAQAPANAPSVAVRRSRAQLVQQAATLGSTTPGTLGCAAGSTQPIEITTLAQSLKCDPDLIFEYVYNNIEYEPLFGSNKGALGTLLDLRGSDIDQVQLLAALLQASGFPASAITYVYGVVALNGSDAANWLGVKNDGYAILNLLANGGIPLEGWNIDSQQGTLTAVAFAHVWAQIQLPGNPCGGPCVFEPSIKGHNVNPGLGNLGTLLQYSQQAFLSAAGGTTDTVSISGINRANVRSTLVGYADNLINYIKQTNPAWTLNDVIGGKTIVPLRGSPIRWSLNPFAVSPQPTGFPQTWANAAVPNAYRTCFTITLPITGVSPQSCASWTPGSQAILLYSDQTYGHRITVFSVQNGTANSFTPTLLIDGASPPNGQNTGTATAFGVNWGIVVNVTSPDAVSNQVSTLNVKAGGSYLIGAGWGQVGRGMVEKHRKQLSQAIAAAGPNPPLSSEPILGETLAVISYNWLAELAAQQQVGDQIAHVTTQYHHGLGITAQSVIQSTNFEGPYVDLPMNFVTIGQQTCWPNTSCPFTSGTLLQSFFTTADVSSSLESAVLEQTQAQISMVAASTIRLIDMNVSSGPANGRTFFADGTTAGGQAAYTSSIRPNLVANGYATADLQFIDGAVSGGRQLVLPIQGNIAVGHWVGAGYTVLGYTKDAQGNVTGIEVTQKVVASAAGSVASPTCFRRP
jgi:Transglutaminase-like superfamily